MEKEWQVYRKKVNNYYDTGGKLTQYPSKKPLRILALIKIAEKFDQGRNYTEKEVNQIILDSITFGDVELIRRELFEYKFLGRRRDGSAYWQDENWKERYAAYCADPASETC